MKRKIPSAMFDHFYPCSDSNGNIVRLLADEVFCEWSLRISSESYYRFLQEVGSTISNEISMQGEAMVVTTVARRGDCVKMKSSWVVTNADKEFMLGIVRAEQEELASNAKKGEFARSRERKENGEYAR